MVAIQGSQSFDKDRVAPEHDAKSIPRLCRNLETKSFGMRVKKSCSSRRRNKHIVSRVGVFQFLRDHREPQPRLEDIWYQFGALKYLLDLEKLVLLAREVAMVVTGCGVFCASPMAKKKRGPYDSASSV